MGTSRNIHLGPHMIVRFKSIETTSKRYTCINEDCGEYNSKDFKASDKFCHSCGRELGEKAYKSSHVPSISDLAFDDEGEYNDDLNWAEDEFWPVIENAGKIKVSRDGVEKEVERRELEVYFRQGWQMVGELDCDVERYYPLYIGIDRPQTVDFDYGRSVVRMNPGDIKKELDQAIKEYDEKIKIIANMDGVVDLEINWGLLTWYS